MKRKYRVMILLVLVGALVLALLSYTSLLGSEPQADRLIQIVATTAIAITVVIALSGSDPAVKEIAATIDCSIDRKAHRWSFVHDDKQLTDELSEYYANCPTPITSYKVHFRITNSSGFDWADPVVTFRLPPDKKHPEGSAQSASYTSKTYHSNIYNSATDLKRLDMIDAFVFSNTNLPYWGHGKPLTIWFRMVLENGGSSPFDVEVSVNCRGLTGFSQSVRVDPKTLLGLPTKP